MADVLTYKNLQDKVLQWLDEVGNTDTTLTLVKAALTDAHKTRVSQERWPFMLWHKAEQLAIVAGQQTYALHPEYLRPLYFWNRTMLDYATQYGESTIFQAGLDPNNDIGPALQFVLWSRTEVATQPSAASVIAVTSSQPGTDNGAVSVIIRGDTADGVTTESIVSGASGSVLFTNILKVTKVGTWVGTMTLTSNAAAVTNLKLFASEAGRSYQQIYFLARPDVSAVMDYRFYRQPSPMVNDNDRPDIPTPYEEILVFDALLSFAAYNQYDAMVVNLWTQKRNTLELGLQKNYSDAEALNSATNYTSYVPR